MKFSPLTQITPANVARLAKAWTYDTGAPATATRSRPSSIDNVMYLPIQGTMIVALKADAGTELWKFDLKTIPGIGTNPSAGGRGISYWPGTAQAARASSSPRPTGSSFSSTPRPAADSGPAGLVNLATGVMEKFNPPYSTNMPPALYKNLAIIAGRTGEQGRYGIPGDPRAFDLLTGKEVWRFHVVPPPTKNLRHVGPQRLAGPARPRRVDSDDGRSGQRPGVHRARQRDRSELRQQPAWRESVTRPRCSSCKRRPESASGISR